MLFIVSYANEIINQFTTIRVKEFFQKKYFINSFKHEWRFLKRQGQLTQFFSQFLSSLFSYYDSNLDLQSNLPA